MSTSKPKHIVVDDLMNEIVHVTNQIKGLNMILSEKKRTMAKYFSQSGKTRISNDEAIVFKQERTTIEYDVDAIIANVPKELHDQFIDKAYEISDFKALCRYLKRQNIDPKTIRPYISVKKSVNQAKLSKMYEQNKITLQDLEGCYEATTTESVALRMKNIDKSIDLT